MSVVLAVCSVCAAVAGIVAAAALPAAVSMALGSLDDGDFDVLV